MPITFTDEDMMYLNKELDERLRSIRQGIDTLKAKGDTKFCNKCGHIMHYLKIGNGRLFNCSFCGNRTAEMIKL
ncbi:MAG: hypothetical protein KKA10_08880 [Euryarchaeota archaeon]|nr:hypothetical protein [Euryarchaeota archaeon]